MFKVTNKTGDANGTSRAGEILVTFRDLVIAFGPPEESDEYKVSGEWVFKNDKDGQVFTIYDWKSTNLYDSSLPSVDQFRSRETPTWFNIGSNHVGDVADFKMLVLKQIEYVKRERKAEIALFGASTPYFIVE